MGKGDIKTRRGKLFRGTYGVLRSKKRKVRGIPGPEMVQFKDTAKEPVKPKEKAPKKKRPAPHQSRLQAFYPLPDRRQIP